MQDKFMWAYLIHLSRHMWDDGSAPPRAYLPRTDLKKNNTDVETWDTVVKELASYGVNTLLIDVGDAIQYETHPEIAAEDAWSKDFLKTKLNEIRSLGIEPIPKLNFSAAHDAWLKEYGNMVSTPTYYRVCADVIAEVCEVFGYPRLFHLGFDEENYHFQQRYAIAVVRNEEMWAHDLNFLCNECEKHGARPWMWSSFVKYYRKTFETKISRYVLQSNAFYGMFPFPDEDLQLRSFDPLTPDSYEVLDAMGFEQVPTGSCWNNSVNITQIHVKIMVAVAECSSCL